VRSKRKESGKNRKRNQEEGERKVTGETSFVEWGDIRRLLSEIMKKGMFRM